MKLEITKEHLERAAGVGAKISNKNLSLPVLQCAVFVVSGDRAVLRATNLDVSVEMILKAKIHAEGIVAVNAGILAQTVSAFSGQKLTLTLEGSQLIIRGETGKTALATVDAAEFPTLPYVKENEGLSAELPASDVSSAIRTVSFAAAQTSMKPELASVALLLEKGELVTAATDSFRLAEARRAVKSKAHFGTVLLPARNVPDIIRALEGVEMVEVRVTDNQVTCVTSEGYITTRTVDGAFPEYSAIIPKQFQVRATVLKEDVARAFKMVTIFADSYSQVTLAFGVAKKKFEVESSNVSVGETHEEIDALLEGSDLTIKFNGRYITDALHGISSDSVQLSVAGPGKPMVIEDSPKRGFLYLVMPMNR